MRKVADTSFRPSVLKPLDSLLTIIYKMPKRTILHLWVESNGICQSECTT